MDDAGNCWYFPAMITAQKIPVWQLYGEDNPFPDLLHIEAIVDRAAGLEWRIAPHRHLHLHQVFLVRSGEIFLTVDGMTRRLDPPVVMNIPRGTVHGFSFSAGTDGFVLTLHDGDFAELFASGAAPLTRLSRVFTLPATDGHVRALIKIANWHDSTLPLRRLRLRAAVLELACDLADAVDPAPVAPSGDPRIERFEMLIRSNLATGWHTADYAQALGISERHLRRLCQIATGVSAHAFIDATRLREACRLLAYTRMRIQDVGFALGFDDPAYFARSFRRGVGLSPQEYRKRLEA